MTAELTVYTCVEVGERLKCTSRAVRELVYADRFPQPIDPTLSTRMWTWSSLAIDQYMRGEWKPSAPSALRRDGS